MSTRQLTNNRIGWLFLSLILLFMALGSSMIFVYLCEAQSHVPGLIVTIDGAVYSCIQVTPPASNAPTPSPHPTRSPNSNPPPVPRNCTATKPLTPFPLFWEGPEPTQESAMIPSMQSIGADPAWIAYCQSSPGCLDYCWHLAGH